MLGETIGPPKLGKALLERRGPVGKGVGLAVDILLIVICGVLIARLIWSFLAPEAQVQLPTSGAAQAIDDRSSAPALRANPEILTNFNPFSRDLQATDVVEEDAPETTLNLSIKGIIASTNPADSLVRIQTPDNNVGRYSVGDRVVAGVTIERILSDRVILMRNGTREALLVREKSVIGSVRPDGELIVEPPPQARLPDAVPQAGAAGKSSDPDFPQSKTINLRSLDEFNDRISVAWQTPSNGGESQLIVQRSTRPDFLTEFGVAPGDRLVSVNGQPFRQETVIGLFDALKSETTLTFVLDRDGQEFIRTINTGTNVGE
ncbi:MAG: hypothetical protein CMK07_12770 [Ponticaulis sp.]|nr:hypothetical protein [Ponticaulis sp.]